MAALQPIRLVAGLGNPGQKYQHTRHNVGFLTVDHFLATHGFKPRDWHEKYQGLYFQFKEPTNWAGSWLKPQTYMNLSGDSIAPCLKAMNGSADQLLVIHDELDLEPGVIRLKFGGGAGGHNGLISIIERLQSQEFWRLRIGVGKPGPGFTGRGADWVLDSLPKAQLTELIEKSTDALKTLFDLGPTKALQKIHTA